MIEPSDTNPSDARWRNWAGDELCAPALRRAPATTDELASAIARAAGEGMRVRAVGAGHSFSDIACTDGLQLSLERMRRVLEVDPAAGRVRVQAGRTIREVGHTLPPPGP